MAILSYGSAAAVRMAPPYLPFSRFLQSLDQFAFSLPRCLDRSSWSSESTYHATLLVSAYKFLKLTDAEGSSTSLLQRLVGDPRNRPSILREVLHDAYGEVLGIVSSAQKPADVYPAFSQFRLSGTTHRKAISFLLQACRYARIPVSDEIVSKMRISHAKTAPTEESSEVVNSSMTVDLQNGGKITLSSECNWMTLALDDRKFVLKLVDEMNAYEKRHQRVQEIPEVDEVEAPF